MFLSYVFASALMTATAPTATVIAHQQAPSPREERDSAMMFELGWNSLAGIGVNYAYYVHPNIAIDTGVGFGFAPGSAPIRFGTRARYNWFRSNLTPFFALGLTAIPGGNGNVTYKGREEPIAVKFTPAVQGTVGLSWQSDGGFVAQCGFGYSMNLRDDVYSARTGSDTGLRDSLDLIYGDGPVVSLAIGHAF